MFQNIIDLYDYNTSDSYRTLTNYFYLKKESSTEAYKIDIFAKSR